MEGTEGFIARIFSISNNCLIDVSFLLRTFSRDDTAVLYDFYFILRKECGEEGSNRNSQNEAEASCKSSDHLFHNHFTVEHNPERLGSLLYSQMQKDKDTD